MRKIVFSSMLYKGKR